MEDLSSEEKEYTRGYEHGYQEGLTDQLGPQEYRLEKLRRKKLKEIFEFINKTYTKGEDAKLNDILLAYQLQKDVQDLNNFIEKQQSRSFYLGLLTFLLIAGGLAVYFNSHFGMLIVGIFGVLSLIGFKNQGATHTITN